MKQERMKTVCVSVHRHVHAPVNIQDQKTPKVGKDAYLYVNHINSVWHRLFYSNIHST